MTEAPPKSRQQGPQRILIVGTPCSGRRDTAERLAGYTRLPLVEAPQDDGWIVVAETIDAIDAASGYANLILWLDFGRAGCLMRALGRSLTGIVSFGDTAREIWATPKQGRPRIARKLEGLRPEQTVMQVTRRKDLNFWIARFATRLGV